MNITKVRKISCLSDFWGKIKKRKNEQFEEWCDGLSEKNCGALRKKNYLVTFYHILFLI